MPRRRRPRPGAGIAGQTYLRLDPGNRVSLSYVVSCKNAPIAAWLQNATWAGIDNTGLVFSGADGKVVGTLLKV